MSDEFASITESAPLLEELRTRIQRDGPMTFRDFMDAALYHPSHGYYRTEAGRTSRGGDYVTSPEVHPVFGALLARQLGEMWEALGEPDRFDIVEQGAGRGLLARDIIARVTSSKPAFAEALRYRIVEQSLLLRGEQQRSLAEFESSCIEWLVSFPDDIDGCVVTNELIDAFPVHRVRREGDELREIYVEIEDRRFVDHAGPLSTPAITEYFARLGRLPGDGCIAEVNLEAPVWVALAARSLRRGYVLTLDYGYEARDLYAPWRRDGTLLTFYRQSAGSDPYQRIGRQDMTASVDFTTMRRAGEEAGLRTVAQASQTDFLVRLGISDGVAAIAHERPGKMEEYFARRGVVMALIDPARLGRIKVMLQSKDVPAAPLTGFTDA